MTKEELLEKIPVLTNGIWCEPSDVPYPRQTIKDMWNRLYAEYKNRPHAVEFLNQMRAGTPVPIFYADPEKLAERGMLAYMKVGQVYAPPQTDPETLLHEFRHVQQRRKLTPSFFDRQLSSSCARRWYLMNNLIEAEAYTFEWIAAGEPESRFRDIFNAQARYVCKNIAQRLEEVFNVTVSDLGKKPATFKPNEETMTYMILSRTCVLPDGRNYLFDGENEEKRWRLARDLTCDILPAPIKEKTVRRWFHLGGLPLLNARDNLDPS